jgi:hypothetical protein
VKSAFAGLATSWGLGVVTVRLLCSKFDWSEQNMEDRKKEEKRKKIFLFFSYKVSIKIGFT